MGIYSEHTGSLFDSSAAVLGHGVNTAGLMGAGIAVEFKHRWPDMYVEYKRKCREGELNPGEIMPWAGVYKGYYIINIASQDAPGRNAKLQWVESGIEKSLAWVESMGLDTLAVPRIGCGIGGLQWLDVQDIFEYYTSKSRTNLEVWIK